MNIRLLFCLICTVLPACAATTEDCGQLPDDQTIGNAGCMIVQDGKLLMIQQRISGLWALPGGTAEPGERAVCTAQRETYEETGFRVQVRHKIREFGNGFQLYSCELEQRSSGGPLDKVEVATYSWFDQVQRQSVPLRFEQQRALLDQLVLEEQARKQPTAP